MLFLLLYYTTAGITNQVLRVDNYFYILRFKISCHSDSPPACRAIFLTLSSVDPLLRAPTKKLVLKQLGKMVPKNDNLNLALAEDNKESVMQDRIEAGKKESESLKMGALIVDRIDSPVEPTYEPVEEKEQEPETPAKKAMRESAESVKTNG